ncbi:lanC-like protein 2 isoform X2 [Aethina tumida]|uniref:lanC-like protein 2 isoform X2 n=1 Tax=Aethina tumida TaxID=116153 RepID=UPI00096B3FC2|nr:lanC-like protein 2 isoform X2 [Aethina tumida]
MQRFSHFIQEKYKMATDKHFSNPFPDYTPELGASFIDGHRPKPSCKVTTCIPNRLTATFKQLEKVERGDNTIYTGSGGVAYLKYKHDPNDPNNLNEVLSLLNLKSLRGRRQTFLCGDAGPLVLGILANAKLGNREEADKLYKKLEAMKDDVLEVDSDLANEYMYGRAGYLYALLFLNKNLQPPLVSGELIRSVIEAILICGQTEARKQRSKCPLMYQWHDSYYLGAAHGLSGILYLLLNCTEYLLESEINTLIKPTIDHLATLKFKSGNFPSSLGREQDKYVQWCHGAPGFLYMFSKAYTVFRDEKYLNLALTCGDVIWNRGLLRKGYSICHGVAGNGYCFLELYQLTRDEKHLYRAIRFGEWCVDYTKRHEEKFPDRPLSLYEGIAGPLYFLLDLQHPMSAKFPGFSL